MGVSTWLFVFLYFFASHHIASSGGKKVVIVGGGISGLASARHLCQNGMCDITILEAEGRLGGRMHAEQFHGRLVERGAQYIHGETDNPVYDVLSKEVKLKMLQYQQLNAETLKYFRISGQPLDEETSRKFASAAYGLTARMVENVTETNTNLYKLRNKYDESAKVWEEEMRQSLDGIDRNITDAMLHNVRSYWSTFDGDMPSKVGILYDFYFKDLGFDHVVENESYSNALIGILRKDIPDSAVELHKRVTRIDWNWTAIGQDSCAINTGSPTVARVRVLYSDVQSGEENEICADHVIVTVSIGVLQKYQATLFNPKLPEDKSHAIASQRIGTVNKVLVHFRQPFWKYQLMYVFYDSDISNEFGDDAEWYRHVYIIEEYGDGMLLFWLNAEASTAVSQLTTAEIGEKLIVLLRKILRNDSIPIPGPGDVLVTRWQEEENFLGSYSYVPVGETLENKIIAASPLTISGVPKVLFAGEAMHHTRFSTVDGAYRTGIDEAQRILDSGASTFGRSGYVIFVTFLQACFSVISIR